MRTGKATFRKQITTVAYTTEEGGMWLPAPIPYGKTEPHSILWDDGTRWDRVNGFSKMCDPDRAREIGYVARRNRINGVTMANEIQKHLDAALLEPTDDPVYIATHDTP